MGWCSGGGSRSVVGLAVTGRCFQPAVMLPRNNQAWYAQPAMNLTRLNNYLLIGGYLTLTMLTVYLIVARWVGGN